MDASVLNAPADTIPPDCEPVTWLRYVKGAKAFDALYERGMRCPSNPETVRCLCKNPQTEYCKYWQGLETLVNAIGGATLTMMRRLK